MDEIIFDKSLSYKNKEQRIHVWTDLKVQEQENNEVQNGTVKLLPSTGSVHSQASRVNCWNTHKNTGVVFWGKLTNAYLLTPHTCTRTHGRTKCIWYFVEISPRKFGSVVTPTTKADAYFHTDFKAYSFSHTRMELEGYIQGILKKK